VITDIEKEQAAKFDGFKEVFSLLEKAKSAILITLDEKDSVAVMKFQGRASNAAFVGSLALAQMMISRKFMENICDGLPP
jgi:hypothetical protein